MGNFHGHISDINTVIIIVTAQDMATVAVTTLVFVTKDGMFAHSVMIGSLPNVITVHMSVARVSAVT